MEISDKFIWKPTEETCQHHFLLPQNIRAILIGKSGSGKSVLLNHLLLTPGILDYNNLIVYGKTLFQKEYQIIKKCFDKQFSKEQIKVLFDNQNEVKKEGGVDNFLSNYDGPCFGDITVDFNEDDTTLKDPHEYDETKKHVMVLDDVMLSSQNKVEKFFTMGRHSKINVMYLTQSYFRLQRHSIRSNSNIFIFFKQCDKNLLHIYYDHVSTDCSFEEFKRFCYNVWDSGNHNFVLIDTTKSSDCGKYRKNLSFYWSPKFDRIKQQTLSFDSLLEEE